MSSYCECGKVATIFCDINGDPLPELLCYDCFFVQTTMEMEHAPGQEFDDPIPLPLGEGRVREPGSIPDNVRTHFQGGNP